MGTTTKITMLTMNVRFQLTVPDVVPETRLSTSSRFTWTSTVKNTTTPTTTRISRLILAMLWGTNG